VNVASQVPPEPSPNPLDGQAGQPPEYGTENSGESSSLLALIVGLLIVYAIPGWPVLGLVAYLLNFVSGVPDYAAWLIGVVVFQTITLMLLLAIIHFWERRPFSSAGMRSLSPADVSAAIAAWLLVIALRIAIAHLPLPAFLSPSPVANPSQSSFHFSMTDIPEWSRIVLIVGSAFAAEIGRGYAIERLAELTGSVYVAGGIALLLSLGALSYHQGSNLVLIYLPGQLAFVLLYVWRRNTFACVISHMIANGFSLVVWNNLPPNLKRVLPFFGV
jgi:Type II CAAX prenyl endopeptidase Rce1-like